MSKNQFLKIILFNTIVICGILFFISCSNTFDGKNGVKIVNFPGTDKICQTVDYKDGKKNGLLKEYFKNGNLKTVQHFKDDKNIDSALYYHPNGKLAVIQIRKNGKKEGCWIKYNEAGQLYSSMCFENNLLNGPTLTYSYKSLHLIERFNFKNNSKEGKQELFYNSGKPKSVTYYHDDQLSMGTTEWLETGELINSDFSIKYSEQNKVNIDNKLYYFISLENPQEDDQVFRVSSSDTGRVISQMLRLEKKGNQFVLQFNVYQQGFVMEKVKLAAYRKTRLGNTFIKTISFNASANNY